MNLSDRAWLAIVAANGRVEPKVFRMSRRTFEALRIERGRMSSNSSGWTLYGIEITYDEFLPFGQIELGERE